MLQFFVGTSDDSGRFPQMSRWLGSAEEDGFECKHSEQNDSDEVIIVGKEVQHFHYGFVAECFFGIYLQGCREEVSFSQYFD